MKIHRQVLKKLNIPEFLEFENSQDEDDEEMRKIKKKRSNKERAKVAKANALNVYLKELISESIRSLTSKTQSRAPNRYGHLRFETVITTIVNGDMDLFDQPYSSTMLWNWMAYSPLAGGVNMRDKMIRHSKGITHIIILFLAGSELDLKRLSVIKNKGIPEDLDTGDAIMEIWTIIRRLFEELSELFLLISFISYHRSIK